MKLSFVRPPLISSCSIAILSSVKTFVRLIRDFEIPASSDSLILEMSLLTYLLTLMTQSCVGLQAERRVVEAGIMSPVGCRLRNVNVHGKLRLLTM